MEKSLINPNQRKKFEIQICDEPTDPNRKLGIEASEYLFIQMATERSNCGIIMHPPTDNEIHNYQGQDQIFIVTSISLRAEF